MVTLLTAPECLAAVEAALAREARLAELVDVAVVASPLAEATGALTVAVEGLTTGLDWAENLPPVVLARPLPFTAPNLLTLIFLRLGNWEKAYEHAAANPALSDDVDLLNRLQGGVALAAGPGAPLNDVGSFNHYRRWHNRAVALHYGHLPRPAAVPDLQTAYEQALAAAPDPEWRAFSAKHYATFLLDHGQLTPARQLLTAALAADSLSDAARHELLSVETGVLLQQLTVPYDADLLSETKDKLWQVLQYYEQQARPLNAALTLLDAAQVANFSESFAEALGYLNRAVALLSEADAPPALLANAHYRKGVLLFTWAQQGQPQFYRGALDAYLLALKVFTRNEAFPVFAQIQHHLGVIYSEIPDEAKKKSIWAAVSVSSFNQALEYFTRDTHPYEYATICNHYANALTKYPLTLQTDKFAKALGFYREALAVRTASAYPYERALTLLNFLEAAWQVNLESDPAPEKLLAEMTRYAEEIPDLVPDATLVAAAREHLDRLALVQLN